MALLTSLFSSRGRRSLENPSTPLSAPDDWVWDAMGAVRASSGINVNRETALTYAAWWRGTNLISRDVAKVPMHVFRRGPQGKERDTDHDAYYLLRRQPNREMTPFQFRQILQMHVLSEGNGYAYIDRDGAGRPLELIPLQPYRTYPVRTKGRMWYITELVTGEPRKIPPEDMLHIKGLSFDGLVGYSVIQKARESLGLGMAFDNFGSIIFRNGTHTGVILKHPARLSPEARKNLRESWERMHAGLENSHKTAILEEGMQADKLGMSAKDAQLLDERKFQVREVALWFGIPPHKLGAEISTSYGSLEQENQDYLDSAIDPWLVNWEQECDAKLLTERQKQRDTHVIEFDRKALIRANMAERAGYYHQGLTDGWLCRDEVRAEEGYNPIADGSGTRFLVPLNMGPGGAGDTPATEEKTPAQTQQPGKLLEVPDIRQPDHYSCGACAAMCVGRYFGVGPETLQEWKDALGTDVQQSTRPMAIVEYLTRLGLKVTAASNLSLDDLRRFYANGQPVICPVQDYGPFLPDQAQFDYGHYLTVIGLGMGYVFCQDSSQDNVTDGSDTDSAPGRIMIREADWLKNWHDEDIEGNRYLQFGIAVGDKLLAAAPPRNQEVDADTPDDEAEGGPGQSINPTNQPTTNPVTPDTSPDVPLTGNSPARLGPLVEVHRRLLGDVYRRLAKKVGTQARRAANNPRNFVGWLDSFAGEHRAVVAEALAPAIEALGIVLDRTDLDPGVLADDYLAQLRSDLLDLSGRVTARQLAAAIDRRMTRWERGTVGGLALRCGGPGSGVPGPCPDKDSGDKKDGDDKAPKEEGKEKLEKDIAEMGKTPEGRETVEKGQKLAERVKNGIAEGAKAALNALDDESKGGVSLIAGGIKGKDAKSVAYGAAQLASSVFRCVHEEVFEQMLSDATHGPALVSKLAAKAAAKGVVLAESGLFKAAVWAMGVARGGKQQKSLRCAMIHYRAELTDADKKLLEGLADTAARAIRDTLAEVGVDLDADDIDLAELQDLLAETIQKGDADAPEATEAAPEETPTEKSEDKE